MNKNLYIELLEQRVGDQEMIMEVLNLTSKIRHKAHQDILLKANDEFFNLGDACMEQISELASKQLLNLESDRKFEELVEKFACDSVKEVQKLTDIIFEIGDECLDLYKENAEIQDSKNACYRKETVLIQEENTELFDNFNDLQADMAQEFAELKARYLEVLKQKDEALSISYYNARKNLGRINELKAKKRTLQIPVPRSKDIIPTPTMVPLDIILTKSWIKED